MCCYDIYSLIDRSRITIPIDLEHDHTLGSGTFFLLHKMTCDATQFFEPAQTEILFLKPLCTAMKLKVWEVNISKPK